MFTPFLLLTATSSPPERLSGRGLSPSPLLEVLERILRRLLNGHEGETKVLRDGSRVVVHVDLVRLRRVDGALRQLGVIGQAVRLDLVGGVDWEEMW